LRQLGAESWRFGAPAIGGLDFGFGEEPHPCDSPERPTHLRLDQPEAGDIDAYMLADLKDVVALHSAAFLGEVGETHGDARAIRAVNNRIDRDGKPVLPADPSLHALHWLAPTPRPACARER